MNGKREIEREYGPERGKKGENGERRSMKFQHSEGTKEIQPGKGKWGKRKRNRNLCPEQSGE
jgi:hypothetical protein